MAMEGRNIINVLDIDYYLQEKMGMGQTETKQHKHLSNRYDPKRENPDSYASTQQTFVICAINRLNCWLDEHSPLQSHSPVTNK